MEALAPGGRMITPPGERAVIAPAIARVHSLENDSFRGTAFAVREQTAVTAFHCVADAPGSEHAVDRVGLAFAGGERIAARVAAGRRSEDWAILDMQQPVSASSYLIAVEPAVSVLAAGRCLGFAQNAAVVSLFAARATVVATEGTIDSAAVVQLDVEPAKAGLALHGMSGGPVLVGTPEKAVGIVRSHLPDPEDPAKPAGGAVFACPGSVIAEALGPQPPGPVRSAAELGELEGELAAKASTGDVDAAARLGELLFTAGRPEAEPWLRQAAEAGHAAAAFELGRHLEFTGRADEALPWFRRAATGGDVFGANTMGIRLRQQGRNDAALPWLEAAIEGGDAMAAHTMARILEDWGRADEALRWERFSAELGDVRAAYDLGRMLHERGQEDDARYWVGRGAAGGDPDAAALLEQLEAGG